MSKPDFGDPFVRATLERTAEGRRALWHYQQSQGLGISKATRRAERRVAERQATRVLEQDDEWPTPPSTREPTPG